jgi:hypothetical protein
MIAVKFESYDRLGACMVKDTLSYELRPFFEQRRRQFASQDTLTFAKGFELGNSSVYGKRPIEGHSRNNHFPP